MQQYFVDRPLKIGEEYLFNKEQTHHAQTVLKMNHERVRLVYEEKAFFAEAYKSDHGFVGKILQEDHHVNELPIRITLAMALIRREKMELILQKATELGVDRIVPFESSRCVVHARSEKAERQNQRWQAIVQEASEQCKRNRIPTVCEIRSFKELKNLESETKLCAYEALTHDGVRLSDVRLGNTVTIVIGPEGGFSAQEVELLSEFGYQSVGLGSRILRAETAAMYSLSVLAELSEQSL